jgi:diadenosine tetraphosphate (Ap4A) HIT family hydrolase
MRRLLTTKGRTRRGGFPGPWCGDLSIKAAEVFRDCYPAFPAKDYALTVQRIRQDGQCFICRVVDRIHSYSHQIVYQDADTIVFLNRYPTFLGYCLVSPSKHVEDWARDLSESEFLAFQSVVHRVARAIAAAVPAERIYSLSLGSQQANAHVHWHVAPLPPGFPYEHQEFSALRKDNGILDIAEADQGKLARTIGSHL